MEEVDKRLQEVIEKLSLSSAGKMLLDLSSERGAKTKIEWSSDLKADEVASYSPLPDTDGSSSARLNPKASVPELVVGLGHELVHSMQHKVTKTLRPDDTRSEINHYLRMSFEAEREAYAMTCLIAWELKDAGYKPGYEAARRDLNLPTLVDRFEKSLAEAMNEGESLGDAKVKALADCQKHFERAPEFLNLRIRIEVKAERIFHDMRELQRGHAHEH